MPAVKLGDLHHLQKLQYKESNDSVYPVEVTYSHPDTIDTGMVWVWKYLGMVCVPMHRLRTVDGEPLTCGCATPCGEVEV